MSEQKKDVPNRFEEQLLGYGGSYKDVFFIETEWEQSTMEIMTTSHPPQHRSHLVALSIEGVCNCM